jgi:hypothetical protein
VLAGEHAWLEKGGIPLEYTVEDLKPRLPGAAQTPPRVEPKSEPRPAIATPAVPVA